MIDKHSGKNIPDVDDYLETDVRISGVHPDAIKLGWVVDFPDHLKTPDTRRILHAEVFAFAFRQYDKFCLVKEPGRPIVKGGWELHEYTRKVWDLTCQGAGARRLSELEIASETRALIDRGFVVRVQRTLSLEPPTAPKHCECGSAKLKLPVHSTWCPCA